MKYVVDFTNMELLLKEIDEIDEILGYKTRSGNLINLSCSNFEIVVILSLGVIKITKIIKNVL